MSGWNLADILDLVARSAPEAPAQVQVPLQAQEQVPRGGSGPRRFTWRELDQRSDAIARTLLEHGARRQDKVAQYLYNGPEYMESVIGCFKASLVPVNTNYRYVDNELRYLWDNADVVAVVFHGTFSERIAGLRSALPRIHTWLWVDDGSGPCPEWAIPYEQAALQGGVLDLPWRRDGDDLWLLYTGGTTGMPKGVMWRHDDLWHLINTGRPEPFDLSGGLPGLAPQMDRLLVRRRQLPACPLMHGTGFLTALGGLLNGGCVVTLEGRHFDPIAVLDAIHQERIAALAIVGDAFARPLVQTLDGEPGRWDLSSVEFIVSSGVMWSAEVKRGLLRHNPKMILRDGLGSSEAIGMGASESTGEAASGTAAFALGPNACVLTEDGKKVEPGSGQAGRIAVRGHLPLGYYKDPEKTSRTFFVVDGERYSIAGDWATVEADGSMRLLGRGSVCINSGGEKIFPEEVEEALKRHAAVRDAVCVGVPNERFGEVVTAIVELAEGDASRSARAHEAELIGWVKRELAPYKAPKHVLVRVSLGRSPSGKADYGGLRRWAIETIAQLGA